MALFDALTSEVEQRFDLGGKSQTLLQALLGLMTTENTNGLSGFLNLFRRVGLGELVATWVSSGANTQLSNQQAEDALGADLIGKIAAQTNLPAQTVLPALAYMIPAIIDALTPDGVVPNSRNLAATLGSYRAGSGATTVGALPERTIAATDNPAGNQILRVVLPVLLLVLFGFLGVQFCTRPNQPVALVNANANRVVNSNANTAAVTTNSAIDGNVNHSDAH